MSEKVGDRYWYVVKMVPNLVQVPVYRRKDAIDDDAGIYPDPIRFVSEQRGWRPDCVGTFAGFEFTRDGTGYVLVCFNEQPRLIDAVAEVTPREALTILGRDPDGWPGCRLKGVRG